jgi:ATP-dependent Clp protease ATP-binding subunit ClpC
MMFERFTSRARQIMALAQDQARARSHDHVGTEHILLGLIQQGESVATQVLESLGVSLDAASQQLEQTLGSGGGAASGHVPLAPQARKVLQLSLREALQLGHSYIGTEHILLGLIREGEGAAAQVLAGLGVDLAKTRHRVLQLLHSYQEHAASAACDRGAHRAQPPGRPRRRPPIAELVAQVESMNSRLAAVEKRTGMNAKTTELDQRIVQVRRDKETAIDAEDYDKAATLRNAERLLLAERRARQQERSDAAPDLLSLADGLRRLSDQVNRLQLILRQHGITPQDGAA